MTNQTDDNRTSVTNKPETRKRIADVVQWACASFPKSVAADDGKALIVAELILRVVEGRDD